VFAENAARHMGRLLAAIRMPLGPRTSLMRRLWCRRYARWRWSSPPTRWSS